MEDDWDKFWRLRDRPMSHKIREVFQKNFYAFYGYITGHFGMKHFTYMPTSLEIGCGRATLSDYISKIGFETFTMDQLIRPENKHFFIQGDVLSSIWPTEEMFNLIVSYGLLEHFKGRDQIQILYNCVKYLLPGGIQIHYVVPKKLTNIFEDRSVYRDNCKDLIGGSNPLWVYPVFGKRWVTNRTLGKGFIIYGVKNDEDIGSRNREITKH